ncbi:hypothetical protein VFPPC_15306 [Pochonia chlamydosporia 170]|uniref:Uncharacterized protein n=1 Tax=Pochonia chlamydosporia 170 TaxID=1380566 RepID=A0A179G7H5_METCM|nr:hypothetical protein VFPPC_15306 [Pochonia chlamydosporia 170]OAQ73460.1 hypothetical protein VFPPC_15306 [Pochonia chlamydosporia 170]
MTPIKENVWSKMTEKSTVMIAASSWADITPQGYNRSESISTATMLSAGAMMLRT